MALVTFRSPPLQPGWPIPTDLDHHAALTMYIRNVSNNCDLDCFTAMNPATLLSSVWPGLTPEGDAVLSAFFLHPMIQGSSLGVLFQAGWATIDGSVLLAADQATDSLSFLFWKYVDYVDSLQPFVLNTFACCAALLICCTCISGLCVRRFAEEVPHGILVTSNWLLCFVIVFGLMSLRELALPPMPAAAKAMIFTLSVAAWVLCPWRLAMFLAPIAGYRLIVAASMYVALILLIAIRPGMP